MCNSSLIRHSTPLLALSAIFLSLIFLSSKGLSQEWIWGTTQLSGDGAASVNGIAADSEGNCYVTGYFDGTISADNLPAIPSQGGQDMFVIKYNGKGAILWAQTFGSAVSGEKGSDIVVDAQGHCYVVGSLGSNAELIDIDGSSLPGGIGGMDIFVAKLHKENGEIIWGHLHGTNDNEDYGNDIALDSNGNVYITGSIYGGYAFGLFGEQSVLTTSGADREYITVKYNSQGIAQWALQATHGLNKGSSNGQALAFDRFNNLYVTGWYTDKIDFGSGFLNHGDLGDIFIVKYNSSGNALWSRSYGGNSASPVDIAVDIAQNAIYLAGKSENAVHLGGLTLNLGPGVLTQSFVGKLTAEGDGIWGLQGGAVGHHDTVGKICTNMAGHVFVTMGWYSDGSQSNEIFVASITPDGTPVLNKYGEGTGNDAATCITYRGGNLYIGGYITEESTLDGTFPTIHLPAQGEKDLFVGRIDLKANDNL